MKVKHTIQQMAWYKCAAIGRFQTDDCLDGQWVAGINSTWHVDIENYSKSKYSLDQQGLLQIKDVTKAENGTMYRCAVQTCKACSPESIHIILLFYPEEGKTNNMHIGIILVQIYQRSSTNAVP